MNIAIGLGALYLLYNVMAWKASKNLTNYFVQCGQQVYRKPDRSSDMQVVAQEVQSCVEGKLGFFDKIFIKMEPGEKK